MNEEEIKALSINADKNEINLRNNPSDYAATAIKGGAGMIPFVGSLLAEVIGTSIPNQRIERIAQTMELFAGKVSELDKEVLRQKMLTEEFADLLEDATQQAARALSDERKEYIASLLANSLAKDEIDHFHQKKLLSILGELNDVEIIFLRHKSLAFGENRDFFMTHREVLDDPRHSSDRNFQTEAQKLAIRESFVNKLFELGLFQKRFIRIEKDEIPKIDKNTGMLKSESHEVSKLGRALLRYIGHPATVDRIRAEREAAAAQNAEGEIVL